MAPDRRLIQHHHQQEERKVINAGLRRRFWSLVGAIGFGDVVRRADHDADGGTLSRQSSFRRFDSSAIASSE
jgi:hypothetical protein